MIIELRIGAIGPPKIPEKTITARRPSTTVLFEIIIVCIINKQPVNPLTTPIIRGIETRV